MIYYQLANIQDFSEQSLIRFLLRIGVTNAVYYTCREVLNRALQDNPRNILVAGEEAPTDNKYFNCKEVLGNRENIERLLQEILDRNMSSHGIRITVGNRFFCWSPATAMRSPIGSLISGILKIVVRFPCEETDYDKFKTEIITTAVKAGGYLSDYTTNASVAIAIKLFSEYPMPDDPHRGYSAMGTNNYLQNMRSSIPIPAKTRNELHKFFLDAGVKQSTLDSLFRKE